MNVRKKPNKARKNQGRCDVCPKHIKIGEMYYRIYRHATEDERRDPKVRTVNPFAGRGPMIEMKFHEACADKVVLPR